MGKAQELLSNNSWINNIIHNFQSSYLENNIIISKINTKGVIIDHEPLIADFGDILPFLNFFGLSQFATTQIQTAKNFLWHGLYKTNNRVNLFNNHDWLLGLLDLYRQQNDVEYLNMAEEAAQTLIKVFFKKGFLLDEPYSIHSFRSFVGRALPFNGGYIELWIELYQYTKKEIYLDAAHKLARTWTNTSFFKKYGLFERRQSVRSAALSTFINKKTGVRVQLFKDNTNMAWSLLSLYNVSKENYIKESLDKWINGFESLLLNDGQVYLNINGKMQPWDISLKAAFSSIDLFCDIITAKDFNNEKLIKISNTIADYWISLRWNNGLFPENSEADVDHLDANVDMSVALSRLCLLTDNHYYWQVAQQCKESLLKAHVTPYGYCMAVDKNGNIKDDRIIIKYQSLLTKLAFLPEHITNFDEEDLALLRDR